MVLFLLFFWETLNSGANSMPMPKKRPQRYLQQLQCNACKMHTYLEPWCKKCAYNIGVCVKPTGAVGELLTGYTIDARYDRSTGPYLAASRDASGRRSWAAMAAHSSQPNAALAQVGSHVILQLTKPIGARTCITIDYGTEYWHSLRNHVTVGLWDYLETEAFPQDTIREEKDRIARRLRAPQQKIIMPLFQLYDEQHDSTGIDLLDYKTRTQLQEWHGSVRGVAYRTGLPVSTVHRWRTQILKKPSNTYRAV